MRIVDRHIERMREEVTEVLSRQLDQSRGQLPAAADQVDGELISDHNDIWGDSVVGFIRDLIVLSTLPVQ